MDPVALTPTELVPGRPFTDPELTKQDLSMLHQMLTDLRGVLEEAKVPPARVVPYHQMAWRVDGHGRRLIICNEERLGTHPDLCIVGFFGDRRTEIDISPLEEANASVVSEFPDNPGILSYSSISVEGGQWGNMVLHEDPRDAERWRESQVHARAVEMLSPIHYRCVRIHNARLDARLFEDPDIVVHRTKYFDFVGQPEWQGVRTVAESPPV
ncbi:MAG: hypothetical protein BMS9Abin07_1654 [Acidimicrobiia bacterium]|nr:MAG: hypothetical protein BMS9Abin07_1654 [Acidimicrobiia bacterium]